MQPGEAFPDDQAYIDVTDVFIESIQHLTEQQQVDVLAEVVNLCAAPGGAHTLSNKDGQRLAGFNTVDVLNKTYRVVFSSSTQEVEGRQVGQVRALVCGRRRDNAVYDMAESFRASGRFSEEEMQEIWVAIAFLDVVAEDLGMDGWDYAPEPAPDGMVKAAVAAGVLDEATTRTLSIRELQAAMIHAWGDAGPDPALALAAAAQEARSGVDGPDLSRIFAARDLPRCGAVMARTKKRCIRKVGHPGPHRSSV